MSILKSLTFTPVIRASLATPEQQRRAKMIAHLQEQIAIAQGDMNGTEFSVKKRRWEHTEDGQKFLIEMNKRLKRWWSKSSDGSMVLVVRWGAKPMEFEKGKAGIEVADLPSVIVTLEKLIAATQAGELDNMIALMNKQRVLAKRKAA